MKVIQTIGIVIIFLGASHYIWDQFSSSEINDCRGGNVSRNHHQEIESEDLVSLEMKMQYPTLLMTDSEIREPVLLSLNVNESLNYTRPPLDVVWVIDTSGSMFGEKLDLLKQTLRYLITLFDDGDRISIVSFSHYVKSATPLSYVSKFDFDSLIDGLEADGGTIILSGLKQAVSILNKRADQSRIASVFLLSDGLDNERGARATIQDFLEKNSCAGSFSLHTFGYGYDHDPKLMGEIASSRGNFYFIEQLETADESFADALGGLISVVGEQALLSVRPVNSPLFSHLKFEKAYGGDLLWEKSSDGWYSTRIRQLSSGKNKNFVLGLSLGSYTRKNFEIPEGGIKIAEARFTMRAAGTKKLITKTFELKVNMTSSLEDFKRQDPDVKVLLNYHRVRAGEVLVESSKLADQGKYEEGRIKLENLKNELGNSSISDDGFIQGTVNDLNHTISEMYPEMYGSLGKHHIQQAAGSYISEKSSPYLNNTALSYNTTNTKQSELINQTRARRNASFANNSMDTANFTNETNYNDHSNITESD